VKKALVLILTLLLVFIFSGCAKPKPAKEARTKHLKAKMYDLDRKLIKAEKKAALKAILTKKQKARAAQVKKDLAKARQDIEAMKQRLDSIATVTVEAWDGFTASLEQGMDKLSGNIETIIGDFEEKNREETQPQ
jgi:hypothetical protein